MKRRKAVSLPTVITDTGPVGMSAAMIRAGPNADRAPAKLAVSPAAINSLCERPESGERPGCSEDIKERFGQAVRRWRVNSGLSQEKLAERAELHRTYVSDIERGARNPSLESMERLAKGLKVSVATLLQPVEDAPDRVGKNYGRPKNDN